MKVIFLAVLPLMIISACNDDPQKMVAGDSKKQDTLKAFLLKAATVEKITSLPGELLPYEVVEIHPKIPGYIKELKVDIGSDVKKGQVLGVIEAPEIESRLAESGSRMQAAKAKYNGSKDTYDRILIASKSDGVIAANELERAKNQMLTDSADYAAASYSARSSKQIGNYLVIVAPFSGTITERNVHEGAYVGTPNEKPMLVLENNSKLRLRVPFPEALSSVSLKNHSIHFSTRSSPNQLYEGKLSRRSGSIDAGTRTEIWEFEINNNSHALKPGGFADVKLDVSRSQPSFSVPFSAVTTTLEKKFITRVRSQVVEWVEVSNGMSQPDAQEVFGKLNEGDTILLKGNEELKPGTRVVVKLSR
jgi:membrane fusion protein (multidrug efflux system)